MKILSLVFILALSQNSFANDVTKREAGRVLDAVADAVAVGGYEIGLSKIVKNQNLAEKDLLAIAGLLKVDAEKIKELGKNSYFGAVVKTTDEKQVHFYAVGKTYGSVAHLGWYTANGLETDIGYADESQKAALTEILKNGDLKTFALHDDELFAEIQDELESNR